MFMISVFEERGPMLTDCGLLVWKSMIQLQREGIRPSMSRLSVSVEGMMVLNTELYLINRILTWLSLFAVEILG